MADCSKTEDYFAEHDRMCGCAKNCDVCPFSIDNNDFGMPCDDYEREHTKDAIIALQKWSDTHPQVAKDHTYFVEFYTRNPDCEYSQAAIAKYLCRDIMFCNCKKNNCGNVGYRIFDKCFECWNEPYQEKDENDG